MAINLIEVAASLIEVVAGTVLFVAGVTKLRDRSEFFNTLERYLSFPRWLLRFSSSALPIAEVAVGAVLIAGIGNQLPSILALTLFALFAVILSTALLRGLAGLPCGCFGSGSEALSWALVRRNVVLAMLLLVPLAEANTRSFATRLPIILLALVFLVLASASREIKGLDGGRMKVA